MLATSRVVLKEGSRGKEVYNLQAGLKQLNFYSGKIDSIFGSQTKIAVINFQKAYGLVADGIVGSQTWEKLEEQLNQNLPKDKWRKMTAAEEIDEIKSIISHRMGVVALNQVTMENFIGYSCTRSFYINDRFDGFQTLMRVQCTPPRGASSVTSYDEIRVIFNRFEGYIEDFQIERISPDITPKIELPD
ncbi:MAG: peptidoglycan-binding domain-containing protein [Nostocaceae cyanobacterium]|nr:peptidoglycan-binding domain-containing protein [Nostocaceae cyanobacterium]